MPQRPPARHSRRAAIALAGLAALAAGAQAQSPAADGPRAYVSHQGGDLGVIDLTTMQPLHEIDVQASEPRGLGVTDDGKLLVSANRENSNISVIDRATGQVLRQVKIGVNPEFVRVKGRLAFVSFEPSSTGGPPPKKFDDIFADAYRRAELRLREAVSRGELVPLEVIAQRMGTTHESLTESVWAGRLFSVPVAQRVFFPAFFADPGLARTGQDAGVHPARTEEFGPGCEDR